MRFAWKTMPQHCSWDDLVAVWREVDRIELYESAWNFDHFYPIYGDADGPCLEAWVTLSALARETSRVRIGCMVNGAVYRHPAVLASMASTLDVVSGGRLELGLGAAWNEQECDAYGIELGPMRDRFDRFEEYLQCVTGLLRDETTTFSGRWYRLTDARNEPKGPQQPHPPICIGGAGERRTLPLVARYAQHWNFPGGTVETFRAKLDRLHECCAAVGRDPSEILVSTHLPALPGQTADDVVRQAEAYAEAGLQLGIVYPWPPFDPAAVEALARRLEPLAG